MPPFSSNAAALAMSGKPALYGALAEQLEALLTGEPDPIANAANAAAAIWHALPGLNWAGFYFLRDDTLVLGPFQGRPACTRIKLGAGVCGAAARDRRSILVPDVAAFPGHIACDIASRSELVVPLLRANREDQTKEAASEGTATKPRVIGVLDLDSPDLARFDRQDQTGCETLAAIVVRHLARSVLF
jgi:GAF domain-containing protein